MSFVNNTFYDFAVEIIGQVPDTALWIYDLGCLLAIISAFCLFIIPISLILKKVLGA